MAELIAALDFPETDQILSMAGTLRGIVPWCKVGMEAFVLAGPDIIAKLSGMGFRVFLDLKFYDIPNTVAQAVRAGVKTGASLMTIHCQGGQKMCEAAMDAAEQAASGGKRPYIFGVTALTSFGPCEMPGISLMPTDFALELARSADQWGLDGVVCSGKEVRNIKRETSLLALCPGIRPAGADANDQARVCTPTAAVRDGADFLVVGRPITRAADPAAAARAIIREMETAG